MILTVAWMQVASKEFTPRLDCLPLEVDEDEETVKIVQLVKSQVCILYTLDTALNSGQC